MERSDLSTCQNINTDMLIIKQYSSSRCFICGIWRWPQLYDRHK